MSKKLEDSAKKFDREAFFGPLKAIELVKTNATAKFDETVEAAFNLGIDPKQADQGVRGTVSPPWHRQERSRLWPSPKVSTLVPPRPPGLFSWVAPTWPQLSPPVPSHSIGTSRSPTHH